MKRKIGVLLVNLGTPDSPSRRDVAKYLKQFLLDPRVIDIHWLKRQFLVRGIIAPFRSKSSSKLYLKLWTDKGSPLKFHGESLANNVREKLNNGYEVQLAMRYQSPSIREGINKLMKKNIQDLIVVPLFPHYASASSGSVYDEISNVFKNKEAVPAIHFAGSFPDDNGLVEVFSQRARLKDPSKYDHILFSYHGLPWRHIQKTDANNVCRNDGQCCASWTEKNHFCYLAQCFKTTELISQELGLQKDKYTICFQSRLGREEWIKPYTPEILKERARTGDKKLLVFSPAFVSDCLETTIEIEDEYREDWIKLGGEQLDLVESLNDHPVWVNSIVERIKKITFA